MGYKNLRNTWHKNIKRLLKTQVLFNNILGIFGNTQYSKLLKDSRVTSSIIVMGLT